jgi:aryl-alcohol dehydrogenase-like predicted oxidoreductase
LTGKYLDGIPEDSRLTQDGYDWLLEDIEERRERGEFEIVRGLMAFAEKKGCTPAQLALAWCLKNQNVSTILVGATTADQLRENLACIDVAKELTDEEMEILEDILGNKPDEWIGPGGAGSRQIKTL